MDITFLQPLFCVLLQIVSSELQGSFPQLSFDDVNTEYRFYVLSLSLQLRNEALNIGC